jgi:hypothetical protein
MPPAPLQPANNVRLSAAFVARRQNDRLEG